MSKKVTKIIIEIPYEIGTSEFDNLMDTLGEMNRDNFFEYTIKAEAIKTIIAKFNPSKRHSKKSDLNETMEI